MLFNKSVQGYEIKAELNITPLVDIILVLLIIFIITAPMIRPQQLHISLPKTSAVSIKELPGKPIEIALNSQGQAFVGGRSVSEAELEIELSRLGHEGDAHMRLIIDQSLPYGRVAELLAKIQAHGISHISFSTVLH